MSEENYQIQFCERNYHIDVFKVTQNGKTSVINDVTVYKDETYKIYDIDDDTKFVEKEVVVLNNPHNDEIYYLIDEHAVINFISNHQLYALVGNISSKDIFDAIYDEELKLLTQEATKEYKRHTNQPQDFDQGQVVSK